MPPDRREPASIVPLLAVILLGVALVIAVVPTVKDPRIQIGGSGSGLPEEKLPPYRVSLAHRWWIERENRRMFEEILRAAVRQNRQQKRDAENVVCGCPDPGQK